MEQMMQKIEVVLPPAPRLVAKILRLSDTVPNDPHSTYWLGLCSGGYSGPYKTIDAAQQAATHHEDRAQHIIQCTPEGL